ncbi:MAG TPA: aspartate carbamoyltransferase catalytic subunit [Alphaproteobacteria bacterium]
MSSAAQKAIPMAVFPHQHLTGINALSPDDIRTILDRAQDYARRLEDSSFRSDLLRGRVIMSLFFENSTRTRVSFEMAAKRLGADVINWDVEASSLKKGESFSDTISTLNAMKPDAIVIRHSEFGAPDYVAQRVDCPVINAGDSWREHPTQALLDALTLQQRGLKLDGSLTVAICGDIAHSRVASSNMILLRKMGVNVNIIAPAPLMPKKLPAGGVKTFSSLEEGLKGCDAVMMLRLQRERMQDGMIGSEDEYFRQYGLTMEKLALAEPAALVMHPGPMNRGVEIADDVADDPTRSLILQQVANGVPVRMAVLGLLVNK